MEIIGKSAELKDFLSVSESVTGALQTPISFAKALPGADYDGDFRLEALARSFGFLLRVREDVLCWDVEFHLESFGRASLDSMSKRWLEERENFEASLQFGRDRNSVFSLAINGLDPELLDRDDDWSNLDFRASAEFSSFGEKWLSLRQVVVDMFSVLVSLLAVSEPRESSNDDALGEFEGAVLDIRVRKYERSRANRAHCLEVHGYRCSGCGLMLEEKYGEIGSRVIHVHHIVPVAQMGGAYRLNPVRDLVPLCPNCHNVVHRTNPPVTVKGLNSLTGYRPLTNGGLVQDDTSHPHG